MKRPGYYPTTVSNAFVNLAQSEAQIISPIKMQKLLYFAHGFSLALFHKPLLNDSFYAWSNGPALPELSRRIKEQGEGYVKEFPEGKHEIISAEDMRIISHVWNLYGKKSTKRLIDITHRKNTPWYMKWKNGSGFMEKIPNDLIEFHFMQHLDSN